MLALLLCTVITGSLAYLPEGKDPNIMSGLLLRELASRMSGKDFPSDLAYVDFSETRLPLGVRSLGRDMEEEQLFPLDYDALGDGNLQANIRDREFLEHSSLYGNQFMSGGAGEGKQRLHPDGTMKNRQEVKTDATLPAYCNPPNPCPVGYAEDQGCLVEFQNTASYSRRYQSAQDCMCDTEHMFDCPSPNESIDDTMDTINDLEFNRFLQHTMQMNPALEHKSLVAKKFHQTRPHDDQNSNKFNPFLAGEKLPVAAKKGNNVVF